MRNMTVAGPMFVATNLSGVYAKVRRPDIAAGPFNIGSLFNPNFLSRLLALHTPTARAFREKVLSRHWLPEDQISPLLMPQIGVTHLLTANVKVAEASFTSNNWSGGTIRGTWTDVVGIWRIPTVTKPSTPPGTGGTWNSSSWVGIDGTYGSNDVLQAGIQQQVSINGDASYVAWYEWFAPKQPNSPPYIFQTNIDNMPVFPGDEVFCGVHYVNRQGEIIFGNVDRGKYFSIVIAPPPGASFSGNSAEWITEAPSGGEPGTSIPRFTPVVFSSAFAGGPGSTSGDPAAGDTTNIQVFGQTLTSVSLRLDALEIDYVDPVPSLRWFLLSKGFDPSQGIRHIQPPITSVRDFMGFP